ncbi:cellulose synthase/poly-beta-1,6-N-acetylglucosamine synthase-like glycosyltransferase [Palleronia aestuarii]|uniref:Cellulose synthase/poly-beta-1,6-N-acetylglucosamine synthase-like glycosyltransferase n=1 Tax=Palleronia aestuarii TaxID=568105 RepID=A0A2W7NBQ1_9RHOB|nr:glycosyltransferase family 2 protein [Palleronia aestuarii]PZX17053.1 cellulose synthase/poly-beta-1,6-N-acetylglucosamine synthase-like glycosyltransferase [Palleronia aestuarii]
MTFCNLAIFRAPPALRHGDAPPVSILIPARNEAANIGPAIDHALAGGGEIEVVVLDDGSDDGTGRIVEERAASDPRVRLLSGKGLPKGWNGKQHACFTLARAARHDVLLFVDADVRIAPGGAARMAAHLAARGLDLVSGFPRQRTETLAEKLVIPQIFVLLLGYLPLPMARAFPSEGFAAGCGQLMMVRKDAYVRSGGHAEIRTTMHDGLMLPRLMRRTGGRTDLVDATPLATCRMYETWPEIWSGFSKNATEGMAKPVALPVWTILLLGGHVLPYLLVVSILLSGGTGPLGWSLAALVLVLAARLATALVVRQSMLSVLLHPVAICIVLAIQWNALVGAGRGRGRSWRGRTYDAS